MAENRGRSSLFAPRIEKSGECGTFRVSGWRYADLPIWHVNVWDAIEQRPEQVFMVAAGEFYPPSLSNEARLAALHLIAMWEQNEVT